MRKGRGHMTASILSQTARAHDFLTHETEWSSAVTWV